MANLTYNGIVLSDITTLQFEQEPIFDESGVDYLYTKFFIHVKAYFNAALSPALANEPPAQTHARIRACLAKPRQVLFFSDGTNLINSPILGTFSDAKNGPLPSLFSVKQLTPATYIVEFSITTWVNECCNGNVAPPILSNRWQEQVAIDENFLTKIIRTGRLTIRADAIADQMVNGVDAYRSDILVACPLRAGFKRIQSDYLMTKDGLNIQYTITDQEQYAMPPPGITKFEGEYKSSTNYGARYDEECITRVWGDKTAAKATLIGVGVRMALCRIAGQCGVPLPPGKVLKAAYIMDRLHENYVEIHMAVMSTAAIQTFYGMNLLGKGNNLDPPFGVGAVNAAPPDPTDRGTARLLMVAQYFRDPCLNLTTSTLTTMKQSVLTALNPNVSAASVNTVPMLPNQATLYSQSDLTGAIYTDYIIDTHYEDNEHILQMALADTTIAKCRFAKLGQPTWRKIVKWTAERVGQQPKLPDEDSTDPNETLISNITSAISPDVQPDGYTITWRCSGTYVYGLEDPNLVTIKGGRVPYLNITFAQSELVAGDFIDGIIDT